ncbi:hypothetical protein IX51_05830 [uncultured archaeon]|nr:hypothetical protein IX51_05830 [uncultured archaeon]
MNRTSKIVVAIMGVVLLITPLSYFEYANRQSTEPAPVSLVLGPELKISSNSPLTNNTTITLQVTAIDPGVLEHKGYFMHTYPSAENASVLLLNTTLINQTSSLFLPAEFYHIVKQWKALYAGQPHVNLPSLQINAFKTVNDNGVLRVYSYYNNIPYNPYNMAEKQTSNLTVMRGLTNGTDVNVTGVNNVTFSNLNLSTGIYFSDRPVQEMAVQSPKYDLQALPESYTYYYYNTTSYKTYDSTQYVNTIYSSLPLMAVHMSNAVANGKSQIAFGAFIAFQSDSVNMNSVNAYNATSGQISTKMSTSPSYVHEANLSETSYSSEYNAIPLNLFSGQENLILRENQTTSYVGIGNVTYTFTHYNQYTDKYQNEYERICQIYPDGTQNCHTVFIKSTLVSRTYDGNGTIGAMSAVNTTNGQLVMSAGFLPMYAGNVLQKLIGTSNGTVYLSTSTPGNVVQASTVWADTYGYTNAKNIIGTASDALDTFSSAISLGLAIADMLSAEGIIGEPGEIADTIGLIGDTLGMTGTILGLFSSISFISGSNSATMSYSATDSIEIEPGSNYTATFYESYSPVTFNENGNTYSFYAPLNYLNVTGMS